MVADSQKVDAQSGAALFCEQSGLCLAVPICSGAVDAVDPVATRSLRELRRDARGVLRGCGSSPTGHAHTV